MNPQTLKELNTLTNSDDYSPELEAQDPYFDRATQLELRRRIADMDAGRGEQHNLIEVDLCRDSI